VCYQSPDDLETAEYVKFIPRSANITNYAIQTPLKEILQNGCVGPPWREEDVTRTTFCLAVVLRAPKATLGGRKIAPRGA